MSLSNPRMTRRLPLFVVIGAGALARVAEGLSGVALIWMVVNMDQGAAPVGYLAAASLAALMLSCVFGGALVDRFGARRTAVVASIASALPIVALILIAATDHLDLAVLFGLVILAQLPDGATEAAFEARLPDLAETADLPLERVNAADDLIDGLAGITAAPIAGLIILHAGVGPALWIAVGVGLVSALGAALALPNTKPPGGGDGGVTLGFRFLFARRDLLILLAAVAILIAAFQTLEDVVLPVLIAHAGHGPDALGIVIGCAGGGAIIGSILYMALARRVSSRPAFLGPVFLIGLSLAAIAVSPSWPVLLLASGCAGAGAGVLSPLVNTLLQRAAPQALRGRVLGAAAALALSLAPITAGLSGVLIDRIGAGGVMAVFAALIFCTAVCSPPRPASLQ